MVCQNSDKAAALYRRVCQTNSLRCFLILFVYEGRPTELLFEKKLGQSDPVNGQSVEQSADISTDQKIAEQTKVSPKTVKRAEKFANAVDKVAENVGIYYF